VSLEEFVKRGQAAQAAVDAALKPKSGAGLWRYENSGHVRCVLCDKVIDLMAALKESLAKEEPAQ
jgi:hypothetical protein